MSEVNKEEFDSLKREFDQLKRDVDLLKRDKAFTDSEKQSFASSNKEITALKDITRSIGEDLQDNK